MLGTQVIPWFIMMFPFKAYVSVVPDTIGWNYDCFYRFDRAIIADSRPIFGDQVISIFGQLLLEIYPH